jgi:cytochrome c-type biogenesis protein
MDSSIFFGGSVVAAAIAGSIALFTPCCISVMLPAYFATAFQNRPLLVAMTFLFAAGVAAVILPIAMGAQVLQGTFTTEHTWLYTGMGAALLGLAGFTLLGGKLNLPTPGRRAGGRAGPVSVYSLGVFSGVASSCCAPVLAGVLALSGVASSFGLALGLGSAYVFGMVAPPFVISLLWERFDWRASRLFRARTLTWRIGPLRRTVSATAVASGVLLGLTGAATLIVGLTSDSMPSPRGWQVELSSRLQHYGKLATDAVSFVPGSLAAVALGLVVLALARRALGPADARGPRRRRQSPARRRRRAAAGGISSEPEYA